MSVRKYKPNNVYILEINGKYYYGGCHTQTKKMSKADILNSSANPLRKACRKKVITFQEYRECCQLAHIEEYNTPEEALDREIEIIAELKKKIRRALP